MLLPFAVEHLEAAWPRFECPAVCRRARHVTLHFVLQYLVCSWLLARPHSVSLASHNRGDNPSWGTVSIKTHVTFPTYQTCIEVQSTAATFRERDITYVHDIPGHQPTAGAMPPPKSVPAATAGRPPPKAESAAGAGVKAGAVVAGSPPPKAESAA